MGMNEIQNKVRELRELRRMADELETEITAIQDALKAHMNTEGVDEMSGTDYRITWKSVTTTRMDTTALRRALPDIAERFTKTTTARRFTIA